MAAVYSEQRTVSGWLEAEAALALAQAQAGVLPQPVAEAIATAATLENIEHGRLREQALGTSAALGDRTSESGSARTRSSTSKCSRSDVGPRVATAP